MLCSFAMIATSASGPVMGSFHSYAMDKDAGDLPRQYVGQTSVDIVARKPIHSYERRCHILSTSTGCLSRLSYHWIVLPIKNAQLPQNVLNAA